MNFNLPRPHTITRHLVDNLINAGTSGLPFSTLSKLYVQSQGRRRRPWLERHHEINVHRILKRYATKLGPPGSHTNWIANVHLDTVTYSFTRGDTIHLIA